MMNKHFNEAVEGDDGGLVICRGCKAQGTYTELPAGECPTPYKSDRVLLAESMAREQALQSRLNAADQRIDELTAAQVVERQDEQQMACMPVERCYDVRAKMIIAFNEAGKTGGDLDDRLDAAYKAALRYSPNPLLDSPPAAVALKDHEFRELVNRLRDTAMQYRDKGQLRERISMELRACLDKVKELNT